MRNLQDRPHAERVRFDLMPHHYVVRVILAASTWVFVWGFLLWKPGVAERIPGWAQAVIMGSALLLFVVGLAASRWPPDRRVELIVLSGVALILVADLCVYTWASGSGHLTDLLGWLLVVAGLVIGSVPATAGVVVVSLLGWGAVAWSIVDPDQWSHYAVSLLLAAGLAIFLAILRARLEGGRLGIRRGGERGLRQAETVAAVAQEMPNRAGLADFMAWALPQIRESLGDVLIEVLEADHDEGTLRLVGGQGWMQGLYGKATIPLDSEALPARVYRDRTSELVRDLRRLGVPRLPRYESMGVRSIGCTFIPGAEAPYGTLGACSTRVDGIGPGDVRFLERVARLMGQAVDFYRLEEERSRREKAHHVAQRLSSVGSWDWDVARDTLEWSDEVLRIFGVNREHFGGTYGAFIERVHPDDRAMVHTAFKEGLKGGGFGVAYRLIRPGGEVRFVQGFGEVTTNEVGEPIRLMGTLHDVTDQSRSEEEGRSRERQFEVFLESSPDGVLIAERNRHISYVNESVEAIFGYSRGELLGRPLDLLLPDDARDRHGELEEGYHDAPHVRAMGSTKGDLWGKRKDGSLVPLEISLAPIRAGVHFQVMATIRDVSKRREQESLLNEEQQRFQATFEQAAVGIAHVSLDRRFLRVNRRFSEIVKRTTDELLNVDYDTLVHPEDLKTDKDFLAELLVGTRDTYSLEQRYIRPDHSVVWIEPTVSVVRDKGGKPLYLIYVIADITMRRTLQADLSWEREFLQTIFDNIPVMIVTAMPTSGSEAHPSTLRVNEGFRRMTGWTETGEDLFHVSFPTPELAARFLGPPGPSKAGWEQLELATATGKTLKVAWFRLQLSDGMLVGIGMDESERQELEGQLRQSDKMKAVGELAGGVAHDFNNLLTVIAGRGQLIESELAPESEAYHSVQEILKSAGIAAGVTRDLLAFSRKDEVILEDLSLNGVYLGMERLLGRLIAADVELISRLDPALGVVRASRVQMEQVFLNLIVNATDAMKGRRGGVVTVETINTLIAPEDIPDGSPLEAGPHAAIVVQDTGCGMPPSTVKRIFEPFYTTKESGTGLGLSTVYGIVDQFGGTIQVASTEGVGTTFTVLLPEERENFDGSMVSARGHRAKNLSGTETIILAEDSGELRQLAGEVLAEAGYTVLEARNGADALRIAQRLNGRVDVLVTDVVMPKIRGPELRDQLLALNPQVKTLYMSGYARASLMDLDTEAPACSFLPKPFEIDDLLESLRELIGTR
jgi:PAS domain S-box-containing protein